jgi:nucleotide-binding universal stress UspA family protein
MTHAPTVARVIVGYDGSSPSDLALTTAVQEAATRRAAVHLVCVVEIPAGMPLDVDAHRRAADEVLADAATRAREVIPEHLVSHEVVVGHSASEELVDICGPSDLLVVGTHGHRPVARMLLGSVSTAVSAHAPCPVLVVRGPRTRRTGPVVVGVDGSAIAQQALAFAADTAASTRTRVRAVLALPPMTDAWGFTFPTAEDEADKARALLSQAVAEVSASYPTVEFDEVFVQAHPVDALLRNSRDARLAVVGSRGLGGLRSMVIGSVSRELLHRADCPVAVVHGSRLTLVEAAAV